METIAAAAHANPLLPHAKTMNPPLKNLNTFVPNPIPKTQIHFPLHRPEHKQPVPAAVKKRNPKPASTTSDVLRLMDALKLPIPIDIYTSLIKECTESTDPVLAIELHDHIRRSGIRLSLTAMNQLLLMHVAVECFEHARQLFDEMSVRDFNSWAILIAGSVENGENDEAMRLFVRMLLDKGFENAGADHMELSVPGIVTCVLRACVCTEDFEFGRQVHGWLWKMGFSRNSGLSSFLISFYGKMKHYEGAQSVFEQVNCRDTAVWTSRIVNRCDEGDFESVVSVFTEMGREGVKKNEYTLSNVLKACRKTGALGYGRQVHANAVKLGLESDGFVQCALVDLYGKRGSLRDAAKVFEIGRKKRNNACYNAMFANYMQHGLCIEAIRTLYEMKMAGFKPRESMIKEVELACGRRNPMK